MTTHSWGETAAGLWTLEVDNDGWDDAELVKWDLVLYGTVEETGPYGGSHPLTARSISRHVDGGSSSTRLPLMLATILPVFVSIFWL